jgi:hypothetical protein
VTPALAGFGEDLLAVEAMPDVIAALWPGDRPDRHAVVGDWRALPCADQSRSAIVGDGVLSAVDADPTALLREFLRVLEPGGVIAIRCFCAPDRPEPLDVIVADALAGRVPDMNVLKWRLSMHLAGHDPVFRVPVSLSFQPSVDRASSGADGLDFDFVDLYRGSAWSCASCQKTACVPSLRISKKPSCVRRVIRWPICHRSSLCTNRKKRMTQPTEALNKDPLARRRMGWNGSGYIGSGPGSIVALKEMLAAGVTHTCSSASRASVGFFPAAMMDCS